VRALKKYYLQIYRHTLSAGNEDEWVDINSLEVHPDLAQQLAELGILEIQGECIPSCQVARIQKLIRLRSNFGVNLHGAAIIIDLLERVEMLQDEIDRLKR